jgi:hypothetical protein
MGSVNTHFPNPSEGMPYYYASVDRISIIW